MGCVSAFIDYSLCVFFILSLSLSVSEFECEWVCGCVCFQVKAGGVVSQVLSILFLETEWCSQHRRQCSLEFSFSLVYTPPPIPVVMHLAAKFLHLLVLHTHTSLQTMHLAPSETPRAHPASGCTFSHLWTIVFLPPLVTIKQTISFIFFLSLSFLFFFWWGVSEGSNQF